METKNSELLLSLCQKEEEAHLYDITIFGIPPICFIRRDLRTDYLQKNGIESMSLTGKVSVIDTINSALNSIKSICKLFINYKNIENVFFPFPRVDKIGSLYLDKFTDPFIDLSNAKDSFIIFEPSRGGKHYRPRVHEDKVINIDIITIIAKVTSALFPYLFYVKYKSELEKLKKGIIEVYGVNNKFKHIYRQLVFNYTKVIIYKKILVHFNVKNVFAPAHPEIIFASAELSGAKKFEMQHGITYEPNTLYAGFCEKSTTADFFLAFGDNNPIDVYGIDPRRIINVGWPLPFFLDSISNIKKYKEMDAIVISEPEVTDKIINATIMLAEAYPDSHFYIRPHPLECISKEQMHIISLYSNISIQDNSINIAEVMFGFKIVIGENSSVLYEALSANKKVGKLFMCGLDSKFLVPEDSEMFWEIRNCEDFKIILNGKVEEKRKKSIYSPFNSELFNSLIK